MAPHKDYVVWIAIKVIDMVMKDLVEAQYEPLCVVPDVGWRGESKVNCGDEEGAARNEGLPRADANDQGKELTYERGTSAPGAATSTSAATEYQQFPQQELISRLKG